MEEMERLINGEDLNSTLPLVVYRRPHFYRSQWRQNFVLFK